jgi:lipoprotein-releasing system ATP-binding protein
MMVLTSRIRDALTSGVPAATVRDPMNPLADSTATGAPAALGTGGVHLRVEGVTKVFHHGGRTLGVLKGIDFELRPGEVVGVVGASGVGKSTLLHIIGTLDTPSAGRITFDGVDVTSLDSGPLADFRNRHIGFVFQFHHLLPEFTALENVMMPGLLRGLRFGEMRERAAAILAEVELSHRETHPVGKLSGGERQRVAVARALVLDPPLLLADEPTGNLDPATAERVGDLLMGLNESRSTALVVVTHNAELARRMGRALVLDAGRLV